MLLGESGVGKSSLLHRFTQNEFKDDMRSGIIGDDLSTKLVLKADLYLCSSSIC